jgi:hypothetical protein
LEEHLLRLPDAGLDCGLDELERVRRSALGHVVLLQIAQALRDKRVQVFRPGLRHTHARTHTHTHTQRLIRLSIETTQPWQWAYLRCVLAFEAVAVENAEDG